MANQQSNKVDEDDPDLIALREIALSSLITKEKKRLHDDGNHSLRLNHQQDPKDQMFHSKQLQGQSFRPLHFNGMNFAPNRPNLYQPVRSQSTFYSPMYQQQQPHPRQNFHQHLQPFLAHPMPHLNPNFVAPPRDPSIPQRFISVAPEPMIIGRPIDEEMIMIPEKNETAFEPTPQSRLSPRSAMFVAKNNEALRRQRRRSFTSRSRSRSPYRRYASRTRSRSPHYKGQISHIVQKRDKTPNKFNRKSRSPRRHSRSVEKYVSPQFPDVDRNIKRSRPYKPSRDRNGKQENESRNQDRRISKTSPRNIDKDKSDATEADNGTEKNKSTLESAQHHTRRTKPVDTKEKRVKTEQEIEDELLASTDSDASVKDEDEEEFKVTLDENELDFFDDEEEESENEGRFKSKASTTTTLPKKATALNNFKPSFQTRHNEKFKSERNFARNDFKRSKRNEIDRKSSRSRSPVATQERARGPSPRKLRKPSEACKSSENVAQSSKVVIIRNKEKIEAVKEDPKQVKAPMFKSTFKSLEALSDDKKKDNIAKKDDRVRLVRGSVISKVETTRIDKVAKKKDVDKKRPSIMGRLGGFIKDSNQKSSKSWAKEQIVQILIENFVKDVKRNSVAVQKTLSL